MTDEQQTDPSEAAHRVLNEAIDQYRQHERLDAPRPALNTTQEVWDAIVDSAKQSGNWIEDLSGAGIREYRGCRVVVLRRYGIWAEAIVPSPKEQLAATEASRAWIERQQAWQREQMDQMLDRTAVARHAVRLAAAPLPPCHHSGGGREKAVAGILSVPI